jgi:YcaO-like protein with predicted kinase domain
MNIDDVSNMWDLTATAKMLQELTANNRLWHQFGVTRVANVTGLDRIGIPVYNAIRPNSKSLSISQGKGITTDLAKISAIMETIELWHAENIVGYDLRGCYTDLCMTQAVIDPIFFTDQIDILTTQLEWLASTDLITEQTVYLPKKLISLDTTQLDSVARSFMPSSNGLASGSSREQAMCHGLYELIERDALSRWFELEDIQQDAQLLMLDTIESTIVKDLLLKITNASLNIYLWDIRTNVKAPTYYCVITDIQELPHTLFTGSGTHLISEMALIRAIIEAAQARLTFISGSRDDIFPEFYQEFDPTELVKALQNTRPVKVYQHETISQPGNFLAMQQQLISLLKETGVTRLYAFEHQQPQINIPVVRLISPDLRNDN